MNSAVGPIIDGFIFNTLLRDNMTYLAQTLPSFEALRRANRYRTRWLMIPQDPLTGVPVFDEYTLQCAVTPGSIYWAMMFVNQFGGTGTGPLYSVQISDGCTGEELLSEFMGTQNFPTAQMGNQLPLPYPLIIGQPGLINVRIASQQTTVAGQQQVQLILCGAQPISDEEM